VDQDPLARSQLTMVEEALPSAERGERDRGAFNVVERARLRRQNFLRDDGVLGGGAVSVEAA
jgi:hypothetical protein